MTKIIEVIETLEKRGLGTKEDPIRSIKEKLSDLCKTNYAKWFINKKINKKIKK